MNKVTLKLVFNKTNLFLVKRRHFQKTFLAPFPLYDGRLYSLPTIQYSEEISDMVLLLEVGNMVEQVDLKDNFRAIFVFVFCMTCVSSKL